MQREHGWRTAKRPGVDYFLAYLSQFYEIVLFTSQPPYTAIPIVEKLDPHMIYILYKLFRDSTRYHNKQVIKDLSYLGRDLKKVVMLDTNPKHFSAQPDNAIHMQPWTGSRADTDLVGMIPFLEGISNCQLGTKLLLTNGFDHSHCNLPSSGCPERFAKVCRETHPYSMGGRRGRTKATIALRMGEYAIDQEGALRWWIWILVWGFKSTSAP